MSFKIGDRVLVSSYAYSGKKVASNYKDVLIIIQENSHVPFCIHEKNSYVVVITVESAVLEEIYNSPLYQALKEEE